MPPKRAGASLVKERCKLYERCKPAAVEIPPDSGNKNYRFANFCPAGFASDLQPVESNNVVAFGLVQRLPWLLF
jgi:hypothetical protein